MSKKIVLMPIEVPTGTYCYDYLHRAPTCEHHDNTGGHDVCAYDFMIEQHQEGEGVKKPKECLELTTLHSGAYREK